MPLVVLVLTAAVCLFGAGGVGAQSNGETQREDGTDRGIGGFYEPREPVQVTVELDPHAERALSNNFVAILARVTDLETGEPVGLDYVALAGIAHSTGRRGTEVFSLNYPWLSNPDSGEVGIYKGQVIVPAAGRWTVFVNVFDPIDEATNNVPTALGRGQLEIDVPDAATLQSAAQFGEVTDLPEGNPGEVILLAFHSGFGLAWFVLAGALVCIGVPRRRRWFTENTNDFLDRNVNRLIRGLLAVTAVIWLTGILNLSISVAYPPPLSPDQARALFFLPYAAPYTAALYIKIAAYSAMTLLMIPLARGARRSAADVVADRWATEQEPPSDEAAAATEAAAGPRSDAAKQPGIRRPLTVMFRLSIASILLGGPVILVCVTILKYTHTLSESIRSVTP